MAPGERGLKRGLAERRRTVILMLDETIICETPPLYSCYGRIGKQVWVPITGNLSMIQSHWRGWNIVLFEDRGSPHTAEASLELAFK